MLKRDLHRFIILIDKYGNPPGPKLNGEIISAYGHLDEGYEALVVAVQKQIGVGGYGDVGLERWEMDDRTARPAVPPDGAPPLWGFTKVEES